MANSIDLVTKYEPLLDELYQANCLTKDLEDDTIQFVGADEVKIFKIDMDGLSDYSRSSGFTSGNVTGKWETKTLPYERGRGFSVDSLDNEDSLDMAFGKLSAQFIRTKVTPEVDLIRFGTISTMNNISSANAATLSTGAAVLAAIEDAESQMDDDEVPAEDRILYITPKIFALLKQSAGTRISLANGTDVNFNFSVFDEMKIVKVPQSRFYVGVTKDATTKVISPTVTSSKVTPINFMIVQKTAVSAVTKRQKLRVFSPEENQDADAWKMQYRLNHGIFGYDNKVAGIYLHPAVAVDVE